jgi:hypothetical protein
MCIFYHILVKTSRDLQKIPISIINNLYCQILEEMCKKIKRLAKNDERQRFFANQRSWWKENKGRPKNVSGSISPDEIDPSDKFIHQKISSAKIYRRDFLCGIILLYLIPQ